jgi:predicted nucleotidyltransferase
MMTRGYVIARIAGLARWISIGSRSTISVRKFHVRRLDLFGSAATGNLDRARSDVDLLVEFEAMAPSAYAAAYFGLRAAAETLLGRPVDLMTEAALANPYLRRRIEGERRALFPQP